MKFPSLTLDLDTTYGYLLFPKLEVIYERLKYVTILNSFPYSIKKLPDSLWMGIMLAYGFDLIL